MASRDLEVLALRIESMKLVALASNVLVDLKDHQKAMEALLGDFHNRLYEGDHRDGQEDTQ
jgi:hypothetical protein